MNVHIVIIEHSDDTPEVYAFAHYEDALRRAARAISEDATDDDVQTRAHRLAKSGSVVELEGLLETWAEQCATQREIDVRSVEIE